MDNENDEFYNNPEYIGNQPNNVEEQGETQEDIKINVLIAEIKEKRQNIFSDENNLNRIKQILIGYANKLLEFVNSKIKVELKLTDKDIEESKLKLYPLQSNEKYRTSIQNLRILFNTTIAEFLSSNVSLKCRSVSREHNRRVIQFLMNNQNLNNLLSLKYFECFRYYRGKKLDDEKYRCLEGLHRNYTLFGFDLLGKGYSLGDFVEIDEKVQNLELYVDFTYKELNQNN